MTVIHAQARAVASPNIALVKYWGKRDSVLNLPAADSLSITLDSLQTHTLVQFVDDLETDVVILNGQQVTCSERIRTCLDILRQRADVAWKARIESDNNFPTAAGLASSASGFAALVLAASQALALPLERRFLSSVARQGSGSAARSLFGGFVRMHKGQLADGSDACAEPLHDPQHWPLDVVVAITSQQAKAVASGSGMERTRLTSPYHAAWIDSVAADMDQAMQAIRERDFAALAQVAEHSCLKMHADMLATQPPLIYWNPATLAVMQEVRRLRADDGLDVFFTIDAGPQVKAICTPSARPAVQAALARVAGVSRVLHSHLGNGARTVVAATGSSVPTDA